jgi:hypothetical protein
MKSALLEMDGSPHLTMGYLSEFVLTAYVGWFGDQMIRLKV